jgi:hypothetical protein
MEQLASHWTYFHEIWYFIIFSKSVEKIQVSLKSNNNNGTLHEDLCTFMIISRWILLRMRNFQTKVVEKTKTHILCSITFSRKSCRLWDNVEKHGTARQATYDNIIQRMRFACWITKATDTLRIYNNYCFSTATMVTRTRLSVTLCVHCMSCSFGMSLVSEHRLYNRTGNWNKISN